MNKKETLSRLIKINPAYNSFDLHEADLREADLHGANLRGADLRGADLRWADLCWADLCWADLCWADLCGADLRGVNLSGANLSGANLSGADLRGANLSGVNLSGANLRGADLRGADFSKAKGIVSVHFSGFSMYIRLDKTRIGCQEMENEKWLAIDLDTAVNLGIKPEHFEVYRAFFDAAMLVLKEEAGEKE